MLNNRPDQAFKFRTKNWVEINDYSQGAHNINSQIKFKPAILKSSLCDYSDAYIVVKGTITLVQQGATAAGIQADRNDKKVTSKNSTQFTDCITEINKTQVDNAKDLNVAMPVYNVIEQ